MKTASARRGLSSDVRQCLNGLCQRRGEAEFHSPMRRAGTLLCIQRSQIGGEDRVQTTFVRWATAGAYVN